MTRKKFDPSERGKIKIIVQMIKLNVKSTKGGNLVENVIWDNKQMKYTGIIFGQFSNSSINGYWDRAGKFLGETPDVYDIVIPPSIEEFMDKAQKTVKAELEKRLK